MTTKLIADDEINIRKGISQVLTIGKFDLDIVGEIREGAKGLSSKEKKVDTLLSKEKFLRAWINGKVKSTELKEKMKYYNVDYSNNMGIIIIKSVGKKGHSKENNWHKELLSYGIVNIVEELATEFKFKSVFVDDKMQIVIISDTTPVREWQKLSIELENNINKYLNINVVIDGVFLRKDPIEANIVYKLLCNRLHERSRKSQVVLDVQRFVNRNYMNESLSIAEILESLDVNQNYTSRLFKKEIGTTISDYLTEVRVKNSIVLMRDLDLDTEEISKLVGYSNLSYFSNIFKRYVGISVEDYRGGINRESY